MTNHAAIVFTDGKQVSPGVYLHGAGSSVPALLEKHKQLMGTRSGDLFCAAARFVGVCHEHMEGNQRLGIWNTPEAVKEAIVSDRADSVVGEYTYGYSGVVVVNVRDFSWRAYGGHVAHGLGGAVRA